MKRRADGKKYKIAAETLVLEEGHMVIEASRILLISLGTIHR